jgi:hypothetical protein
MPQNTPVARAGLAPHSQIGLCRVRIVFVRALGDLSQPRQRLPHLACALIPTLLSRPFGFAGIAVPRRSQLGDGIRRMREMGFQLPVELRHPVHHGQQRRRIHAEGTHHNPEPDTSAAFEASVPEYLPAASCRRQDIIVNPWTTWEAPSCHSCQTPEYADAASPDHPEPSNPETSPSSEPSPERKPSATDSNSAATATSSDGVTPSCDTRIPPRPGEQIVAVANSERTGLRNTSPTPISRAELTVRDGHSRSSAKWLDGNENITVRQTWDHDQPDRRNQPTKVC